MKYYIDIKINPDAKKRENVLMNEVYSNLHKVFFDHNTTDIGVSFPQYRIMLGRTLRLYSSEESLKKLQQTGWIGGLIGYCDVSKILSVPDNCQYRVISRIQTTMTQSKLKRLIKRGSISESEVKNYKAKMFSKGLDNPYLELESGSNGHKHRRYIAFGDLLNNSIEGDFDQFGLSKTATLPWF